MCITHTPHRPWARPLLPMGSDLGHFIMPFTCAHTCAKCVLHKLHITHTPRSRRLSKFIPAKSKFRWQINYAQNSWPLCIKEEEQEEAKECQLTASTAKKKNREKQRNRLLATQLPTLPLAGNSTLTSTAASTLATLATLAGKKAASLRSRAPKTYFRSASAGESCARLIC